MTKIEWTEKTWNPVVGCSIVRVQRVGKRAAGRLLDGREWSEMPESRQNPPIATERETP